MNDSLEQPALTHHIPLMKGVMRADAIGWKTTNLHDFAGLTALGGAGEIGLRCSRLEGANVRLSSCWLVTSIAFWESPNLIMPA